MKDEQPEAVAQPKKEKPPIKCIPEFLEKLFYILEVVIYKTCIGRRT
jgi:hypothetical protein